MLKNLIIIPLLIINLLSFNYVYAQKEPIGITSANKVEGLELPVDQVVNYDEGFITIQAKTEGPVKWLVISNTKIKYVTFEENKSIIISVPATGGQITIFAVSVVNNKLTDYAKHIITIKGPVAPPKPDDPKVDPAVEGPFHITFALDLNAVTPELAQVINSPTFAQWAQELKNKAHIVRIYDINSDKLKETKLDLVAKRVGGSAVLIIQNKQGLVLQAVVLPKTEEEIRNIVANITVQKKSEK